MTPPRKLLSIRAYARHRGCSHAAVLKAARYGRISLVDGKVDQVAADRQWMTNTRPRLTLTGDNSVFRPGERRASTRSLARASCGDAALVRTVDSLAPLLAEESDADIVRGLLLAEFKRIAREIRRDIGP